MKCLIVVSILVNALLVMIPASLSFRILPSTALVRPRRSSVGLKSLEDKGVDDDDLAPPPPSDNNNNNNNNDNDNDNNDNDDNNSNYNAMDVADPMDPMDAIDAMKAMESDLGGFEEQEAPYDAEPSTLDDYDAASDRPPLLGTFDLDGSALVVVPAALIGVVGIVVGLYIAAVSTDEIGEALEQVRAQEAAARSQRSAENEQGNKNKCRGICFNQEEDLDNKIEKMNRAELEAGGTQLGKALSIFF